MSASSAMAAGVELVELTSNWEVWVLQGVWGELEKYGTESDDT